MDVAASPAGVTNRNRRPSPETAYGYEVNSEAASTGDRNRDLGDPAVNVGLVFTGTAIKSPFSEM